MSGFAQDAKEMLLFWVEKKILYLLPTVQQE